VDYLNIHIAGLFLGALFLGLFITPKIIAVMKFRQLTEAPNERSSHDADTPNLGGISFYIVFMLSLYFMQPFDESKIMMSILPGVTILFVIGLKDDLVVLSPLSKLGAQIVSAIFLLFQYRYSIESLHGFMGIESMNKFVAGGLVLLIIVAVINAINLVDGIDGLAATVSIIMFALFGIIFYIVEENFMVLVSAAMTGVLCAFLRFNLSRKQKIFMGDTGSMILGFLIGAMTVRLLALDSEDLNMLPIQLENLPLVIGAILIIPLYDSARVFIIRLMKKQSPFAPDRNHIHHVIIDAFRISHRRASFFIGLTNFLIVALFSIMAILTDQWIILAILLLFLIAASLFFFIISNPHTKRKMRARKLNRKFKNKREKQNAQLP
jgi:UDP-N-acetylmuramyl pentapeptide phosphotransferase/UDP-N-acetylglucosamine-1-phosphate transferase